MTRTGPRQMRGGYLMAASVLLAGSVTAFAQEAPPASEQEITVTAPRTVNDRVRRKDRASRGQAVVSVQLGVMYGDLDLALPGDAARLMERVDIAARDACKYLDRLYPLDPDKDCVDRATSDGRPRAQAVVDAVVFRQSQ